MATTKPARTKRKPKEESESGLPVGAVTLSTPLLVSALERLVSIVPRRAGAMSPYEIGVRIQVVEKNVEISAVDGYELYGSVEVPAIDSGGNSVEVWDARKLYAMLKVGNGPEVTLDGSKRSRGTITVGASVYSMPLYGEPEEFPTIEWDDEVASLPASVVDALQRVEYAVGTPDDGLEYSHAQVAEDGRVTGFNGSAIQSVVVAPWSWGSLLVPSPALSHFDFLSIPEGTDEVLLLSGKSGSQEYVGLSVSGRILAYAKPRVEAHDLSTTWGIVSEVLEDSSTLRIETDTLLAALNAAKVQSDPRLPVVTLVLGESCKLTAQTDEVNTFVYSFPSAVTVWEGAKGTEVRVGLYHLFEMVNEAPDEVIDLKIETVVPASRRPYVQLVTSDDAHAVIQQVSGSVGA